MEPIDQFAVVLGLAVVIGCINYVWIKLLVVTYAVVLFTIAMQGLTFARVLQAAYGSEKAA
jgi:hypothetical protein